LTGRNDMVSTLPQQNNSFFYPSASLSYDFTEHFLKNSNLLTFGKLRLSWAQVGKGTNPYVAGTYYDLTNNFPYGGTVDGYRRVSTTADPNLKPERTTSLEIGTELRLFNNKLMIDATYFSADSRDQIVNAPVTNASGYSRYFTNIGLIRNKGVELTVTGRPIQTASGFRWETTLNYSKTQGTVEEMPAALEEIVYFDNGVSQLKVRQGSQIGDLWGFDYRRSPDGQTKSVVSGNALPNFIAGWNNSFNYKGFSLSFLLEWRDGGHVVDLAEVNAVRNGVTELTAQRYERVVFKGVTETINPDKSVSYAPNTNLIVLDDDFYRTASRFFNWRGFNIQDGSWFRLRSINAGYSLPKAMLAKTPFSTIRFTATGVNLFLNTPFRGYDPEALSFGSGTNIIGYVGRNAPSTRSFQFGVNVSLK
jgi:outer membrane receptor protein involved in Fe transport